MNPKINLLCQKILETAFLLLFTLTPLIFTTINYELFEFNKIIFVYLLTIIILTAWIGKMISQKKFIFRKTPLFWPLLIFLSSQIITTATSINRHTSFWGYYTRQNGGLLSLIAYSILYFALVSNINFKKTKQYLKYSLVSLASVSFYGLLQKLGIDNYFWTQDVPARIFSSLGQPNWLAAWICGLIFLTPAFFLKKNKWKPISVIIFVFAFTALLLTRSRSGFLAFWFTYPLFWLTIAIKFPTLANLKKGLLLFTSLGFLLTILFLSPFNQINQYFTHLSLISPQSLPKWNTTNNDNFEPDLGSATADIRKTVWLGAINIFKNYPLLGTGPETFAYSYYWHQPQSHNSLSEWDFLYNKAHNEYLNYLATTGLIGFSAYLILISLTLKYFVNLLKKDQQSIFILALLSGYITILITNFFGFSVVLTNIWLFLTPALAYSLTNQSRSKKVFQHFSKNQKILLIITILVGLNLLFWLTRYWLADYYFARAEKQAQQSHYPQAHLDYQLAHQLNPKEPFYLNKMATNCAYLAIIFHQQENDQETIKFVNQAKELGQNSINLNPYQVNFYRQQSQTHYLLSQIDFNYLKESQRFLLEAHQLAPINPKITYNLAVLSYQLDQLNEGIAWLEKTIQLKSDYQEAYYWLAKFYQENNHKAEEILNQKVF